MTSETFFRTTMLTTRHAARNHVKIRSTQEAVAVSLHVREGSGHEGDELRILHSATIHQKPTVAEDGIVPETQNMSQSKSQMESSSHPENHCMSPVVASTSTV